MEQKYIKSENIKIEEIVNELYDLSKPGAISILGILTADGIEDLIKAFKLNSNLSIDVPRYEGTAYQEMQTLYLDKVQDGQLTAESLPIFNQFKNEYGKIYREIARKARFDELDFNKMGFHRYPEGSFGITPHQDYESHLNLISMFNLVGDANFYYCEDEKKNGSVKLDSSPGSLVLLRAPRNKNEEEYRPFHYIKPMKNERLSLNVRTKINREKK